jgi:chromosome condensin MukBEF complex kleisin-like MukF subunit
MSEPTDTSEIDARLEYLRDRQNATEAGLLIAVILVRDAAVTQDDTDRLTGVIDDLDTWREESLATLAAAVGDKDPWIRKDIHAHKCLPKEIVRGETIELGGTPRELVITDADTDETGEATSDHA